MKTDNTPQMGDETALTIWRTPEGAPVACSEKIKVLNENLEELREQIHDALDDALLMGCDVDQFRQTVAQMVRSLENSFTKK